MRNFPAFQVEEFQNHIEGDSRMLKEHKKKGGEMVNSWKLKLRKKEPDFRRIPTEKIISSPYQPRSRYDLGDIEALSSSVHRWGLLNPLILRKVRGGRYEIIAGERRFRACERLGMAEIPAVIIDVNEKEAGKMILGERAQQTGLSPIERAESYDRMMRESGLSAAELAREIGVQVSEVSEQLRFLSLSAGTRRLMEEYRLEPERMKAVLKEPKEEKKALFTLLQADCPKKKSGKDSKNVYGNTIQKAVGMINLAGAEADSERVETETCVEYIIRIPK